jgi:hypothetical protein
LRFDDSVDAVGNADAGARSSVILEDLFEDGVGVVDVRRRTVRQRG